MPRSIVSASKMALRSRLLKERANEAEHTDMPPISAHAEMKTAILIGESKKFFREMIDRIDAVARPLMRPDTSPQAAK